MNKKHLIINVDETIFNLHSLRKQLWEQQFSLNQWSSDPHFLIRWLDVGMPEKEYAYFQYYRQAALNDIVEAKLFEKIETNSVVYHQDLINFLMGVPDLKITYVSASPRNFIEPLIHLLPSPLQAHPLWCAEEVLAGFPQPDLYLKTMHQVDITSQDTLVLESSRQGLLAAYQLGVHTIFWESVFSVQDHEDLKKYAQSRIKSVSQLESLLTK